MKLSRLFAVGAIVALAAFAVACSSDSNADDDITQELPPAARDGGGAAGIMPTVEEMLKPGQFLSFEGNQYELVDVAFTDSVGNEFEAVGEVPASEVDISGDRRILQRNGDTTSIYTYTPSTVEDPGFLLTWTLR